MNTFSQRSLTRSEFLDSFRLARLVFGFRRSLPFKVACVFDVVPLLDGVAWHGVYSAAAPFDGLAFPRIGRQRRNIPTPKGKLP